MPIEILSPLQRGFLQAFFAEEIGSRFFLTGGTALAAFHLYHRLSIDLDLFTQNDLALEASIRPIDQVAARLNCRLERTRVSQYFQQIYLTHPDQPDSLKIDLIRDFGPLYGERTMYEGMIVDSLDNIAANKILAIFGRAATKDFVDLYFILRQGYNWRKLFEMAQAKDPGLTLFYFAGMLRQIERPQELPDILVPLELKDLQGCFLSMAHEIISALNPEQT
jgi:predicted nucleotidyltransferase component of viral defense system